MSEDISEAVLDAIEEGSDCPCSGCSGEMKESPPIGCSCHINPPCSACTDAGYECDTCGFETSPYEDEVYEPPIIAKRDRSSETTTTETANHFNSTPFTRCCGVAAVNTDRCPSCNAQITGHDDGLAEVRRWAKGGCLMCGKPRGDIRVAGNCCC